VPFSRLASEFVYQNDCVMSHHIGPLEVFPINLSHANGGLGFKFVERDKSFVFLTDNELGHRHRGGLTMPDYVEFARNADLLIHDAEYTPEEIAVTRGWGHSTYLEALELAINANVAQLGLFHHNQDRNDEDVDVIVAHCREIVVSQKARPEVFAVSQDTTLIL